jgi:hypothetical protein
MKQKQIQIDEKEIIKKYFLFKKAGNDFFSIISKIEDEETLQELMMKLKALEQEKGDMPVIKELKTRLGSIPNYIG